MSTSLESGETFRRPKKIITLRRAPRSFGVPFNMASNSVPQVVQHESASWNMMPLSSSPSTSTIIFLPSSYCHALPSVDSNIVFTKAQTSNSQMPLECSAQFYQQYSQFLPEQLSDNQQLEILNAAAQQSEALNTFQGDMLNIEQGERLNTQQSESMYTREGEVLYAQQSDTFNTQQSEILSQMLLQPHPIHEVKIEQRSLQPTCYICNRVFGQKKNMYRHMRIVHAINQALSKQPIVTCPLCKDTFPTANKLNVHFVSHHDINIEKELLDFNSLQEFFGWKEKMERETKTFYRTYHSTKNGQKIIYVCNRMGIYVPKRKGEKRRELKGKGSKRMGGVCPARITMVQTADKVLVTFIKSHVGHDLELRALDLTRSERRYLAAKMAQGYSKQMLLDKINETISPTMRMSYITMKDLHNIAKSVSAKSRMRFEADNAPSVDLFIQQLKDKSNNNCNDGYSEVDTSNVDEQPSNSNDMQISSAVYEHVPTVTDVEYEHTDVNIDNRKLALIERFTNLVNKSRSNEDLDVIAKHLARIGPGLRAIKQPTVSLGDAMVRTKLLPHQRRILVPLKIKRKIKAQPGPQQNTNIYDTNLMAETLQYAV